MIDIIEKLKLVATDNPWAQHRAIAANAIEEIARLRARDELLTAEVERLRKADRIGVETPPEAEPHEPWLSHKDLESDAPPTLKLSDVVFTRGGDAVYRAGPFGLVVAPGHYRGIAPSFDRVAWFAHTDLARILQWFICSATAEWHTEWDRQRVASTPAVPVEDTK
jgi:hypothetical protein